MSGRLLRASKFFSEVEQVDSKADNDVAADIRMLS